MTLYYQTRPWNFEKQNMSYLAFVLMKTLACFRRQNDSIFGYRETGRRDFKKDQFSFLPKDFEEEEVATFKTFIHTTSQKSSLCCTSAFFFSKLISWTDNSAESLLVQVSKCLN